ncbi:hypothetical protein N7535_004999 [Penicillium sp. DV-2018c]|nr:hypothetical protein N7535_004999 [Penicillium sp. DV-2018c]
MQRVVCQRLFYSNQGSHFIHVLEPGPGHEPRAPPSTATQANKAMDELLAAFERETQAEAEIQPGNTNEANPWLDRTGWATYLNGRKASDLRMCIESPKEDAEGDEGTALVIWNAILSLARKTQSVTKRTGRLLRTEAARTDRDRTPSKPLQAYMQMETQLKKHIDPWRRILMFFARTQVHHDWNSPYYRFTTGQRKAWDALWHSAQSEQDQPTPISTENHDADLDPLQPVESSCMNFMLELLNQNVKGSEYELALVCALAVLGVNDYETGRAWKDAHSYPPILSSVIKVARFLVVHKAFLLDPKVPELLQAGRARLQGEWEDSNAMGYDFADGCDVRSSAAQNSALTSSDPAPGCTNTWRDWVHRMVMSFMVRGTGSPMEWIMDLRRYGMKIHFNTPMPGHISWSHGDTLLYKQLRFTMREFKGFVHGLTASTRKLLIDRILLTQADQLPVIPWDRMADDFNQPMPGWNFLQDKRTPWPIEGSQWMVNRVREGQQPQRYFLEAGRGDLSLVAINRWFGYVQDFEEKLAVLVHITGGQPPRAPELLSIRHRNTANSGLRNVFIEDGLVAFVTRYHKGFYASGDAKVIHRYVPREVGELVVWYLWLVLPFHEMLQAHHREKCNLDAIPDTTASLMRGVDAGSGRTWTSDRVRDVMTRESTERLRNRLTLPAYRDIAIAISRKFLGSIKAFSQDVFEGGSEGYEDDDDEDDMDDEQWTHHIASLQAAHSTHVAEVAYAGMMTQQEGTMAGRQAGFRRASIHWHDFLGYNVQSVPSCVLGKRARPRWKDEEVESRNDRLYLVETTNMTEALQRMTGNPTMQFRGIQGQAIDSIKRGDPQVVVVMPSGGGKSMLFMLPAWVAQHMGGMTIVVVPLIALRAELIGRCEAAGIPCVEWDSHRHPDHAGLVFVTPEAIHTDEFQSFLNRQRDAMRLDRIVIDECHLMLNTSATFRPVLQQLERMHQFGAQMVLLTATLPPSEENRLVKRMQVEKKIVNVFRQRTSRANVAYLVHRPQIASQHWSWYQWLDDPGVQQFLRERVRRAQPGKVIVYGSTRANVTQVSEILGCSAFYSSQDEKIGILKQFSRDSNGVIAATSGLGIGMDIPDIRLVIHIGFPRTLLDYAQESGRAGRDFLPSQSIIIQPAQLDQTPPWFEQATPDQREGFELIRNYMLRANPCRRVLLDKYLDGVIDGYSRQKCQDQDHSEQRCDLCHPDWDDAQSPAVFDDGDSEFLTPEVPASELRSEPVHGVPIEAQHRYHRQQMEQNAVTAKVRTRQSQKMEGLETLRQDIRDWKDRCFLCVQAGQQNVNHEVWDCPSEESAACQKWVADYRGKVTFEELDIPCCYRCYLPQLICGKDSKDRSLCQYRAFFLPFFAMLIHWEWPSKGRRGARWFTQMMRSYNVQEHDKEAMLEHFAKQSDAGFSQLVHDYLALRRMYLDHGYQGG